ncbi:MAG: ATP phosphoribosyltransferase regulatory subunit [Chloroflexi bacterium]|nr:ATP phosphoribosyltransferase regulatory subunit [Chloroflexota bacterium]
MAKPRGAARRLDSQRVSGTRDLLPEEMARFRRWERLFLEACQARGYREIRTPTLEHLYFFTAAQRLSLERLRSLYSFPDMDGWSGERVVLRPDGTIPIARLYAENYPGQTMRLCYVENLFSYQDSAEHRRESWQCGAELIGASSPEADGELLELASQVLAAGGVQTELHIFHAGLTPAVLGALGGPASRRARAAQDVQRALERLGRGRGGSAAFLKNLRATLAPGAPAMLAALDNLIAVAALLDRRGLSYTMDPIFFPEFEYYTGAMFAFFRDGRKVGGGGRYDDLIPKISGHQTPASGFALYLDTLLERES